jgi:hypothetical protein
VVERHVVADDGRLADHHSHAVIDEHAPADGCAGMDFNACPEPGDLGEKSRRQAEATTPEPVDDVMMPHRVKSGIVQQHGECASCRRIAIQHGLNVFSNLLQHALPLLPGFRIAWIPRPRWLSFVDQFG